MRNEKFYLRIWKLLQLVGHRFIVTKFNFKHDRVTEDGPFLVISNHVTNWDPMLVAISFPKNNLHYVASEHLFRMGFVSKLINFLVAPISRRKGTSGLDTAMNTLRTLRAGGSVCIFGEGECTWDGNSVGIVSSTGTLARACGAKLVTYRLEGGYFTFPRWALKQRRGKMRGHVVNVYTPEQLKGMRPDAITEMINRDIFENAQERQDSEKIRYRSRRRAENLETTLFMCPKCHRVGTLKSSGVRFCCECGLDVEFTEYGEFEPASPFRTIIEWDKWQHEMLRSGEYAHGEADFTDEGVALIEIDEEHNMHEVYRGALTLKDGMLHIGGHVFDMMQIPSMAIVRTNRLYIDYDGKYYELRAFEPRCLRKYRSAWQMMHAQDEGK